MKKTSLHFGLLVVGASLLATPTLAQDDSANNSTVNRTTTIRTEEREEKSDYGWIGLLGLAGLAGLLKKPERQIVHHTDTVVTTPTGPGTGPHINR